MTLLRGESRRVIKNNMVFEKIIKTRAEHSRDAAADKMRVANSVNPKQGLFADLFQGTAEGLSPDASGESFVDLSELKVIDLSKCLVKESVDSPAGSVGVAVDLSVDSSVNLPEVLFENSSIAESEEVGMFEFNASKAKLYLASASQRRKDLLQQIAVFPDFIMPADINEEHIAGESVQQMTVRLAKEKARKVAAQIDNGYVLGADTAIETGGRTLGKAEDAEAVFKMINRLSGRKHRVYSTVVLLKVEKGQIVKEACKTSKTTVALKTVTSAELKEYVASSLGIGREGGFNIQSQLEAYIKSIEGSYSGIIGLPLYETNNILISLGYKNK